MRFSPAASGCSRSIRTTARSSSSSVRWSSPLAAVGAAAGRGASASARVTHVRRVTARGSSLSSTIRTASVARSGSACGQRRRQCRSRTGPVVWRLTGRQIPPGLWPVPSSAERPNAPVRSRTRPVPTGSWSTSRARRCSSRSRDEVGDLEPVGHRVAGGVTQVGAVEPHVGGGHHALEDQEGTFVGAGAGGRAVEPGAVGERTVVLGEGLGGAPVAGDRHRLPVAVVQRLVGVALVEVVDGGRGGAPRAGEVEGGPARHRPPR